MKPLYLVFAAVLLIGQTAPVPPAPAPANAPVLSYALPREFANVVPIRNADGTYIIHSTMKAAKALKVYRNGMRQKPALDYDYAPTTGIITPRAGTNWQPDDTVLLDFVM